MINIVTGPPRAGKSYFITYWLYKNYLTFDNETANYKMKNDALLVANVDGLRIPHKKLDDLLRENDMTADQFFCESVQKELSIKYPTIIYVVDEAHKYFPAEMSRKSSVAKSVRDYFAYHGHYNQHFWLLTQDVSSMFQSIVKLAECEYSTVRNSISPPGRFRYNLKVPGKMGSFEKITLPKLKKVFNLYRSADNKETEKAKRTKAFLYLYMLAAGAVLLIGLLVYQFATFGDRRKIQKTPVAQAKEITQTVKSSPGSTINPKQIIKAALPHEVTQEGLSWQSVPYIFHPDTNRIDVLDNTFGWIDLKDFEYEFKIVNSHIFALLPPPKDTGEADAEPEALGEREIL